MPESGRERIRRNRNIIGNSPERKPLRKGERSGFRFAADGDPGRENAPDPGHLSLEYTEMDRFFLRTLPFLFQGLVIE